MTAPDDDAGPRPDGSDSVRVNGRSARAAGSERADRSAADPAEDAVEVLAEFDGLTWRASYDRDSVDAYLAAVEAERVHLLEEIRFAEERAAAAHEQLHEHTTGREARLGALVLAARDEIDRLDREHEAAVESLRAQAAAEAARLRERAEADAAAVREVATSLRTISVQDDAGPAASTVSSPAGDAERDASTDASADHVVPVEETAETTDAADDRRAVAQEQSRAG